MASIDQIAIGNTLNSIVADLRRRCSETAKDPQTELEVVYAIGLRALDTIDQYAPPGSSYADNADAPASRNTGLQGSPHENKRLTNFRIELLHGLATDYLAQRFTDVIATARAEVFGDFLDHATAALREDRGPAPGIAAAVAGTVLEEHLRQMAHKNSLPLDVDGKPKGVGRLNDELFSAGKITRIEHTNIRIWYGIRNEAAHAFDKVDNARAERLIEDVRAFIARHPA